MPHAIYIAFLFALGACIGSFLNVVVWRVPRKGWGSLITPPSHCPRCKHKLAWYDNLPVLGWIFLRGRCRYCREPISGRYPLVEFIAGSLFVFYYVMFFMFHAGPCAPQPAAEFDRLFGQVSFIDRTMTSILADWPMYALYMAMISALLAVSLIDIDLYIIPSEMPWAMAAVGLFAHAVIDHPTVPGALNVARDGIAGPLAAGGAAGLLLSIILFQLKVLPQSFAEGEPAGEVLDEELYQKELAEARREGLPEPSRPRVYTRAEIRREIGKEMLFLTPPLLLAFVSALLWLRVPAVGAFWREALSAHWLSGLLGAALGAMVGGLIIWLTRILGTLVMGRIAMGLGDIHLLFGIGAILGAGAVSLTFFLAPFVGLVVGIWQWVSRRRHELPYGPYLSMAAAASLIVYCPVARYLGPGFAGLGEMIRSLLGG